MNLVLFQHVFWWGSSSRDLCSPEEVWDVRQTPVGMYTSVRVEIPPDAGHVCDWFRQLYNHAFWPANVAQLIRIFIGLYPADTFRTLLFQLRNTCFHIFTHTCDLADTRSICQRPLSVFFAGRPVKLDEALWHLAKRLPD